MTTPADLATRVPRLRPPNPPATHIRGPAGQGPHRHGWDHVDLADNVRNVSPVAMPNARWAVRSFERVAKLYAQMGS